MTGGQLMNFKFLHCADIHLDTPFTGIGSTNEELAKRLKNANKNILSNLGDIAIQNKVDFVIIAGDLFDSVEKSLESQLRCLRVFEKLMKNNIKVFLVAGNHDPLSQRLDIRWPENLILFPSGKPTTHEIMVKNQRVLVHGVSYESPQEKENKVYQFPNGRQDSFNIGVLHCEIGGQEGSNYSPCGIGDLLDKGYDYWALGHIHKQKILSTSPYIVYPGSVQGKSIKEVGEKGCYLINVANGIIEHKFISTHQIIWLEQEIDIKDMNLQSLVKAMGNIIKGVEKEIDCQGAIMRFKLVGKGSLHSITPEQLRDITSEINEQEDFIKKFVWVESIVKDTSPTYDLEFLEGRCDFLGTYLRTVKMLSEDQFKKEEIMSQITLINNRKFAKHISQLDHDKVFQDSKELIINYFLKGEENVD